MDLEISRSLTIPAAELEWSFSRSSGPGGQHVNTSDSQAQLRWNVAESRVLTEQQRERLLERLPGILVDGIIQITASEQRSQLRNRERALVKLGERVRTALRPDGPRRRATKPTRGSQQRRLQAKGQRSQTKQNRRRPAAD
ncbi:aminoacyl-tRNA hydrolase [Mycetocola lacteus]|uniref:Aminoacyl-tRNA hydrolase n=1 Tax=Mycetocola lacteus TaxID=76637 RepID=A0A3L7AUL5_9MICO|nr:alternative ribosome rescue aminoacyl-tRNA hydrolase ArfB [Mycetocola lacteus]RLP83022.1 aminoacyl-tRNA hydrolase [Mycetocola lacteus]